jgi:1-acyl-sn-glycerol-3-phosphate acyltransferase
MIVTFGNLYYYPLKLYVFIASFFYFRKLRVTGRENIPWKGPLIFAINHQNALLDALLLSVISIRNPHFMTRADVFRSGFLNKFLRGLKMLPIYRIRDGFDSIKKNEATFEAANTILQNGGAVGIFPEGSHSLTHRIRPLKKGVARIAFMAEENAGFTLNTKVIPIGIQYESYFYPEGRTLISFGKPIAVSDFENIYLEDKNKGIDQLLSRITRDLKALIVNIESTDYDNVLQSYKKQRIFRSNLVEQLKADQQLISAIECGTPFNLSRQKQNILSVTLRSAWDMLWKIIALIPRWIVDKLVSKTTKDPHFYGTMRFGYSIFLYPVFYLIVFYLIRTLVS